MIDMLFVIDGAAPTGPATTQQRLAVPRTRQPAKAPRNRISSLAQDDSW
jgi:hypothetical protein